MIVREGTAPILVTTATAVLVQIMVGLLWAVAPWLLVALLYWLYRLPRVALIHDPLGVLSPLSGRVTGIAMATDPFRDCPVLRIRLSLAPPGITLIRSPTEGKVLETYLRSGVLGTTLRPTPAAESPDCYAQSLRTDEGDEVLFAISSNWPVSRCTLDHAPGERAGQGQRAGFIYFASDCDVLVPPDSLAQVTVGQRVSAGQTQLARLVH